MAAFSIAYEQPPQQGVHTLTPKSDWQGTCSKTLAKQQQDRERGSALRSPSSRRNSGPCGGCALLIKFCADCCWTSYFGHGVTGLTRSRGKLLLLNIQHPLPIEISVHLFRAHSLILCIKSRGTSGDIPKSVPDPFLPDHRKHFSVTQGCSFHAIPLFPTVHWSWQRQNTHRSRSGWIASALCSRPTIWRHTLPYKSLHSGRGIPHAKGGEPQENRISKASPPHQNVAGSHAPQVLVSGPHLVHEIGCSSAIQYCGLSTLWLQHEGTTMELWTRRLAGSIFPDTTWPNAIDDRKWNLTVGI